MRNSDLHRFARQLKDWAELVIEHGRTPFRRVDLFPRLNTVKGCFQPPLVFWINRQSLMAGGVVLLPDKDLPQQLEFGSAAADALGLRHFITWEKDCIRAWDASATPPRAEKQLTVAAGEDPETFRALLLEVMEQLKLFSVLGMVPPNELSSSYLYNLFQETLDSALEPLITSFRQTRADGGLMAATRADHQAEQLNRLTLLRLLTLLWHDLLPEAILPEKLERAIELALPSLPPELRRPLSYPPARTEPALPVESAVRYHHLILRLRQIRWNSQQERATHAINRLLRTPGMNAKSPFLEEVRDQALLQIHPRTPLLDHDQLHELSDSPPFLAEAALLRYINNLPPAEQYSGDMFSLNLQTLPASRIDGRLVNRRRVPREERKRYDTLLRTSWPTRRFRHAPDAPCWLLESIHLLGLSPAAAQLRLEIPATWLTQDSGEGLWELIMGNFQLQSVTLGEGTTFLQLLKQDPVAVVTAVHGTAEERFIDWGEHPTPRRSLLLFALLLNTEQYQLLNSGLFQDCGAASATVDAGLIAYSKTALARCLTQLLGGDRMPQDSRELRQAGNQLGWPIPEDDILYELGRFAQEGREIPLPGVELDEMLSDLLGSPAPLGMQCPHLPQLPGAQAEHRPSTNGHHRAAILRHLDACGLPDFPAQYLYLLEHPQLATYRFQPPLRIISELLGQFELVDADQKQFVVEGEATVEALKLCSELGRTEVELPEDQRQLNDILTSYRDDLRQLRQELTRQTHTRLENPQTADRMAKKLWQDLNLPPWKWLDH